MSTDKHGFFNRTVDRSQWKLVVGGDSTADELHSEWKEKNSDEGLTETQYFSFHVPEADIAALLYMWHHPNLGVVSVGAMVFRGIKCDVLRCELLDFRAWMNDRVLTREMASLRFDNGYSVEVGLTRDISNALRRRGPRKHV